MNPHYIDLALLLLLLSYWFKFWVCIQQNHLKNLENIYAVLEYALNGMEATEPGMGNCLESTRLTEDLNLQLATGHGELQGWSPGSPRPLFLKFGVGLLSQTACHPLYLVYPHMSDARVLGLRGWSKHCELLDSAIWSAAGVMIRWPQAALVPSGFKTSKTLLSSFVHSMKTGQNLIKYCNVWWSSIQPRMQAAMQTSLEIQDAWNEERLLYSYYQTLRMLRMPRLLSQQEHHCMAPLRCFWRPL